MSDPDWPMLGTLAKENDTLRAEIARLREALKELVGLATMPEHDVAYAHWPEAMEKARAALKGEEGK